eukprot:CAMPEP_0118649096 /NCGR_PEP_ID=MMETSP0785-20121206/9520_1 /TAXON_ID=91992 /ORGANISM="Bolidomonas pacifica, Strain CCMP 1866" /LENGTH=265 /DNA_ID=CAMNT_0006541359 /DNA_START=154 /DNA_END=947 /DNA_ORIENTATION=+
MAAVVRATVGEDHKTERENALGAIGNISCGDGEVKKGMLELDGLMKYLVEVVDKEGDEYKVARKEALGAIANIAHGNGEVTKDMIEFNGLVNCLVKIVGKEGDEYKVAREIALGVIRNIAHGDVEVKKGMFELDGLMKCLVEVLKEEREEFKVARERAVIALRTISFYNSDLHAGFFNYPGFIPSVDAIIGNPSLTGTNTMKWAVELKALINQAAPVENVPPPPVATTNAIYRRIDTIESIVEGRFHKLEDRLGHMETILSRIAS